MSDDFPDDVMAAGYRRQAAAIDRPGSRFSCRAIRWRGFHYVRDVFPQGTVYRVWAGWFLLKWMRPKGSES